MNVLKYIRSLPGRLTGPAEGRGVMMGFGTQVPAPVLSNVLVTPQTALTLTSAYAAINTISSDLSAMWLGCYKRRKGGGADPAPDQAVHELVYTSPDGVIPAYHFRQSLMGHALGWGSGYAEIERDPRDGTPRAFHLLNPSPSATRPQFVKKRLMYEISQDGEPKKWLLPENVLHVRGLGFDGIMGYSPVALARQAIGLGIATEQFGAALFGNGAMPKGFLKTPQKLSKDAAARLRAQFEEAHQGVMNAHRLAVLEQGLEWQNTTIDPDDAQFLLTRQFQVVEVARIYRVPPHKIGDYSRATFANIEEANLDYVMTCLLAWVKALEAELNFKLFTAADRAAGYYLKHNMASLLRGNMAARGAFYRTMFDLGVFSPNDIAELEDHNPVEGGDTHFVPLKMQTVGEAAAAQDQLAQKQKQPAAPPDPADGLPLSDPNQGAAA